MVPPTCTVNAELEQRMGGFKTLVEALEYAARGDTGLNFYSTRGQLETVLPYKDVRQQAITAARKMQSLGLERGSRVGIIANTSPEFVTTFFGCQYAGLVPVPLPYNIHIGGKEAYIERLENMLESAGALVVISPDDLLDQAREAARKPGVAFCLGHTDLAGLAEDPDQLEPLASNEIAYIQYSSGSTSRPKGVTISQRNITENATGILRHGLKMVRGDRAFSWLPLYHDMGLVGFLLSPLMGQVTVDYLSTPAFARRPVLWLRIMSDNGCTVSYSPSFGYDLAVRRVRKEIASLDLSKWRVAGIGGDMVRADILEKFADTFAVAGFSRKAFLPSYGMAEATLAVTFSDLGSDLHLDRIDKAQSKLHKRAVPAQETGQDGVSTTRTFVACGRPLPGHELKVCNDKGDRLGDREIGHIMIRGASIMNGYYRNDDATRGVLTEDGWLCTGDMGYLLDGEIIITGRAKELILHNGRNIWPQDIEWAVERVGSLRNGDAAAFSVERESDETVVVLVQCRLADALKREALRREVGAVVQRHTGVECDVVLVPPRSLPFTSSGKLSRIGAKVRFLSGEISDLSPGGSFPDLRVVSGGKSGHA